MVCNQCKNQLREGAKFCGQCGTKTVLGKESATDRAGDAGYLSKILSVNAMGPDSDGDLSVEVRFSISNQSGSSWDQLITRTQLLSDSGYIEETTDTHEQLVEDGETQELEISFYGVKARPFLASPEKGKVIINLIACTATTKNFDEIELPISSFEVVKIEPSQITNEIQLISGGVWKTDPDEDKDVRVETRWLVKNASGDQIPEFKFIAEVVGNGGTEIGDAGGYEELRPFSTAVVSGSTYAKEKKLKGAKVGLSARVMSLTSAGSIEHIGIELSPYDATDEGNGNGTEDGTGGIDGEVEIARYIRTNEDGSLVCAIAYIQEVIAAWPSNSTRILGAYWGYAGGGVGYDGGFFQLKDDSEPEVLDFEQAEQSDQSEKFTSLMEIVSSLYTDEDGNATLSQDGQKLIDGGHTDGDNKVYWDSKFQGEDLGKISQQWVINWRFDWDDVDSEDSEFVDSSGAIEVALRDEEGDEFIYWVKLDSLPIGEDEIDWAINEATNFHIKNHGTNPATSLNDNDLPVSAYEPFSRQANEFVWVQSTTGDLEHAGLDIETDQNNQVLVEWSIKRAAINVEEIEDEETRSAINSVIQLCKEEKYEEAVGMLPEINFEFDSGNMDSSPDAYLAKGVDSFVVDPSNPRHSLRVILDGDKLILSIAVIFEMSLVAGVTADELNEWLNENGGWAAATASGLWNYLEDEGGSFATVNAVSTGNSNLVSCKYCIDLGRYIFESKASRDKFIKNPKFKFDFQPDNVDDKEGMIRIFGGTNFSPLFNDNPPKFTVSHLEKDEESDLRIVVSVEVEMSFVVNVELDEFRDWIESSDSTWRYSGRIECVGEDGLEDSEREEYEFNW
jgi:hypothetical protein